jgi:RimJ/RimL family protein N-acetyltransferase
VGGAPVYATHDIPGELTTARLRLRPLRRGDAGAVHEAIVESLADLVRWLPWARPGHGRLDTRRYLRAARDAWSRGSAFEFLVLEANRDTAVGMTSLHRIDRSRRSAGLGYWIRSSHQGRGYATEAARATLDHAFRRLELHRVELHIALENAASHGVARQLGARREGVARDAEMISGRFMDHVQYALLSTDPLPEIRG